HWPSEPLLRHGELDPLGEARNAPGNVRWRRSRLDLHANEVSPRLSKCGRQLRRFNIERHAGHLEDFRPPGNEVETALSRYVEILHASRDAEGHVIGACLGNRHGVMTGVARVEPDDPSPADGLARVAIAGLDVLAVTQVYAIGAELLREAEVIQQQRRCSVRLHKLDERACG